MGESRPGVGLVRAAVLVSSVLLMLPGSWGHSATVVEFAQLPSGLAAWQRHELGIYRVCGPASKWLYALPAHLAGVRVEYPRAFDRSSGRREWDLGRLFQTQHRLNYHWIYRWSRMLPIVLTVVGGCLICEWSTRLFGAWPGVASLCAWSWLPPVLAHGSLITSDMPSAVAGLLAARCFWAFLRTPGLSWSLAVGLTLGLAAATKFTLILLYPCWALILIGDAIQVRRAPAATPPQSRARLAGLSVLAVLTSLLVLDAFYLFHDVGFQLSQWPSGRSSMALIADHCRHSRSTSWLLDVPMPIPLELWRGLDAQLADTERLQQGYLLGRVRPGGWWYWYAVAAVIKIPLPALALLVTTLFLLPRVVHDRPRAARMVVCTLAPAAEMALMIATSTGTGTNAAFRYMLPSIALCCVGVGVIWVAGSQSVRIIAVGLLVWLAADAVSGVPDHLGWQNGLGELLSRNRPALLGDSLDWGQDLARLGRWVSEHAGEGRTLVCAYGLGDAEPYGLDAPTAQPTSATWANATYLAVSADLLYGYEVESSVRVAGGDSWLDPETRQAILRCRPVDLVGRTIRIYRIRDL